MTTRRNLGPYRIGSLAERLNLDVAAAEAEEFAAEIAAGLDRYDDLETLVGDGSIVSRETPSGVAFDPGPDQDPLNAYISTFSLQADDASGHELDGLSVAVKDNLAVAGVPMTGGSKVFEDAIPTRNAAVVDRMLDAGAEIPGKTNMDELAYGPTGETSGFGPIANPLDGSRVAGGSSAGSAATVGAGTVDAALGTDTGGSVRIPASFCGLVGVKPTWGLVPSDGLVPLAPTLDTVGPIARSVETAAMVLDVIADGPVHSPSSDSGSFATAVSEQAPIESFSFGVAEEFFGDHVSGGVSATVAAASERVESAGATVERVSLPIVDPAESVWDAIANVEFATSFFTSLASVGRGETPDLGWQAAAAEAVDARSGEFGDVVRSEAIEGAHLLDRFNGRPYVRARTACERLAERAEGVFDRYDAVVTPTMPVVAPEIGAWPIHAYAEGESERTPLSINVRPVNLLGAPAVTLPCGAVDGASVGIQFVAAPGEDRTLLEIASAFGALYP